MSFALRKKQIKYYTDLLKDNEFLLLKSTDSFFNTHYKGSPFNVLTNFIGTAGEAVVSKNGKVKIFVDSRYHLLVEKQVYADVEICKMPFGESFFDVLKKDYPKNTVMYVYSDIKLSDYLKFDKYFDLRTYKLPEKFAMNFDLKKNSRIFKADSKVAGVDFTYKINKLKKSGFSSSKVIIFDLDQISWLVNLRSFQCINSSNFRSIFYVDFDNSDYILFVDCPEKLPKIDGLKYMKLGDYYNFINSINSPICFNYEDITLDKFLSVKKPVQNKKKNLALISSIRQKSEIDYLKDCYKKLDYAILNFKNKLKIGMSEADLIKLFEEELYKTGAKSTSFSTILAIGENTASIHYTFGDKNKFLNKESIILLDCGGYWKNGYATDITRTFYFGEKPKNIYKRIYTFVLKAFIACYLSEETCANRLDEIARKILNPLQKEGFYFSHGLGHGIGTSVHQNPPCLSLNSKDIIKPFQVHSIEPGLYGKSADNVEFGVRIENCVYSDICYKKHSLSNFLFEELLIDYELLDTVERDFIINWQSGKHNENS